MLKQYLISESRLRDLLHSEAKLNALEAGGVDNWSWYGDSLRDFWASVHKGPINEDEFPWDYEEAYIDEQLKNFLEH